MDEATKQPCPICGKNGLTLRDREIDIPYFGKTFVFAMQCSECGFSKADVEFEEKKDPSKITFEVNSEEDLFVRVVKSGSASVKIPGLRMSMDPGENSEGFVTNIEGLIGKFEKILEAQRDEADDKAVRKKAKNLLKKIWKVKLGELPLKIVIEDKTGNSAIVSEKTEVKKLK
ncbi:ZPR1 zinc finger domain-containing protein [Candidatus Woesearchaeota archaeon]|jgi:zinc finger protein|nr:ZPR1 zinc finger domain-containing protein [Candidatus Woesearchaeota archaeon]MBT7237388.1 ZPR1 zinc finger domain-containing protein [Candidatus Woesearchaeota archaeon]